MVQVAVTIIMVILVLTQDLCLQASMSILLSRTTRTKLKTKQNKEHTLEALTKLIYDFIF